MSRSAAFERKRHGVAIPRRFTVLVVGVLGLLIVIVNGTGPVRPVVVGLNSTGMCAVCLNPIGPKGFPVTMKGEVDTEL